MFQSKALIAQDISNIKKEVIDTSAFPKWYTVGKAGICNDGEYVFFTINNLPLGKRTLVFKNINTNWEKDIVNANYPIFTQNSKSAIFLKNNDSLCILKLGSANIEYIPKVKSFKILEYGKSKYLAFLLSNKYNELVVRNLNDKKETSFKDVKHYFTSDNSATIILQKDSLIGNTIQQSLFFFDILNGSIKKIWQGYDLSNVVLDNSGTQLSFIGNERDSMFLVNNSILDSVPKRDIVVNNLFENSRIENENKVWYFKPSMEYATVLTTVLVNDNTNLLHNAMKVIGITRFSDDGNMLFLKLNDIKSNESRFSDCSVDVWSYRDTKLQSQQLLELSSLENTGPNYAAVICIHGGPIAKLQNENENFILFNNRTDEIGLIDPIPSDDYIERYWTKRDSNNVQYIIFTKSRKRVPFKNPILDISKTGKFVILGDVAGRDYFSYEVSTGLIHNITKDLSVGMDDNEDEHSSFKSRGLELAAWLDNDLSLIIYDKYDIWKVDPYGRIPALNLTKGFGRKNGIKFRLINKKDTKAWLHNEGIILDAFNLETKQNGFYKAFTDPKKVPMMLTMGNYSFGGLERGVRPDRSKYKSVFLVQRESSSESPNYFITCNFKTFKRLSEVFPERKYNWLTSKIITFKSLDSSIVKGVLYKPEFFDSTRKYPVIIHFYEKLSNKVFQFHVPQGTADDINIPWFVSHGYVVFTPDINYKIGLPGECALNSVLAAAQYLTRFNWAGSIGIQGHSFGGYETNYIITHTKVFAAAMSSSGPSDFVSGYNAIALESGKSLQMFYEIHQFRIGANLWERPDLYIRNSPIFMANEISTPLLMMNNKDDGIVPFSQGIEFFTALRRLGKKVWMLQYDNEKHSLVNEENKRDCTIRITQFFDYYLNGKSAPKWMTVGVFAKKRGVEKNLELDSVGIVP